ncbi:MAG: hypothetical protein K2X11_08500, partial [Acetobacteraceae bacterium]|nr:hypothetical protein [Acetobacteraceae bacterium]
EQRSRLAAARGARGQQGTPGTVHVAEEGQPPRAVSIRTGLTDGTVTEVLSGDLRPGMQVVVGTERAAAPRGAAPARPLF